MSNYKKTLADVKPGGSVRLGDQSLSTSEGARRYVADFFATELRRHDFGDYILTELAGDFACALAQHLSAQPPPGGQGGLNYERMFVDACAALAEVSRELGCDPEQGGAEPILAAIAELREALAAQPSPGGQGDALDLDRVLSLADVHAEESREDGIRLLDRGGLLGFAQDVASALAARQPVGEPVGRVRTRVDGGFIAELLPGVAERVSNMAPLYLQQPAQAVDLGRFRPFIVEARNNAYAFIETMRKAGRDSSDAREKAAITERLLALIDSQAVGNG
ncbi:hypothetical protein [Stenotrophomonas maltophilia]|uniref:hypothetical protein n=1 Tax=Stenotrophomonas maltophilia TaxID=40324 RepID=UPI003F87C3F8